MLTLTASPGCPLGPGFPSEPCTNTNITFWNTGLHKWDYIQTPWLLTFSPTSPRGPVGPGFPLSPWDKAHSRIINYPSYVQPVLRPHHLLYVLCFQGDQVGRQVLDLPEKERQMMWYFEEAAGVEQQRDHVSLTFAPGSPIAPRPPSAPAWPWWHANKLNTVDSSVIHCMWATEEFHAVILWNEKIITDDRELALSGKHSRKQSHPFPGSSVLPGVTGLSWWTLGGKGRNSEGS